MVSTQSALAPSPSWLDILIGTGAQKQAAEQADALAGRNLQKAGLTGYLEQDGGFLNTLGRDQFNATLAEADRGYALDVARFGLAQADLNYRQRAAEAQDRMQQMALQVSQRGPANAIGYNYLLNNRNAPAGTEKPYGGANISQPANIQVPTPAPQAAPIPKPPSPPTLLGPSAGGFAPAPTPAPAPVSAPTPVASPPPANLSNPDMWAQWSAQFPKMARGGMVDAAPSIDMYRVQSTTPEERERPAFPDGWMPRRPDSTDAGYRQGMDDRESGLSETENPHPEDRAYTNAWLRGYRDARDRVPASRAEEEAPSRPEGMARGGFLDSLGPQQTATAMVGDAPSGMPTGHEEMATATMTPEGKPRLIVAPTQGQPPDPQSPEYQRGFADAQHGTIDQAAMQNPDYQAGVAAFQQQGAQSNGGMPGGEMGGEMPQMPGGSQGGFLDSMSAEMMPHMAAGGVVDVPRPTPTYAGGAGFSGGTANTAYSPQDIANLPVVKQATGQERVSRFGGFGGDTTIPGTGTKLPSGAEFRIDQYADMLPSSRALLESIVSTPREMGGLGLDFQDYLESSRRAAPIGRRFGPAAYGS